MLKEIDTFTLYHPKFTVRLLRIGDLVAWNGWIEDGHTTPEGLKQWYGHSVHIERFGDSVPAAVGYLIEDAASSLSPMTNMMSSDIEDYLREQLKIIKEEKNRD